MKKLEYKITFTNADCLIHEDPEDPGEETHMKQMGEDGWELVSIQFYNETKYNDYAPNTISERLKCYWKREIQTP